MIPRRSQNLSQGSYYGGRRPEDGRIDWRQPASDIYNLIRAVTDPYPGAFALLDQNEKIIIWWARPAASLCGIEPGDMEISGEDVLVKTGNDAIRLLDIEIQGRRMNDSQISEYFKKGKVIKLL